MHLCLQQGNELKVTEGLKVTLLYVVRVPGTLEQPEGRPVSKMQAKKT